MDDSRRGFLKLFGVGTAGAVIAAKFPLSLFGSDEIKSSIRPEMSSGIILPGQDLRGTHWVVYSRPSFVKATRADHDRWARQSVGMKWGPLLEDVWDPNDSVVGRIQTTFPGQKDRYLITDTMRSESWRIDPPSFIEGEDPHATYYRAAHAMRERFAEMSRLVLKQTPEDRRAHIHLTTVINQPIWAEPKPDKGFWVSCDFQMAISGRAPTDLDDWKTYSQVGEYPIEVPSDIEMGILMKLDRQVIATGQTIERLGRRGFFSRWRS